MLQKFTTSILLVLFIFTFSSVYSQSSKQNNYPVLDGSEVGVTNPNKISPTNIEDNNGQPLSVNAYTVTFTSLGITNYYDLQSNGTTNEIWQDPLNPLYVHAAVMVMPVFGSTRFCNYLLSTDRGVTWENFGNIAEAQSGFPSISGLSNGSAIVTMHTLAGGVATARSQVFVDAGAGFGAFDRLDPGQNAGADQIWGRIVATSDITNPTKYVLANSQNPATIASTITGSDLIAPGTFSTYTNYPAQNAEQYALAIGSDGRIGNAFISSATESPDAGDVLFRESMDGGLTWSTPITIYNANIDVDSLGSFRGISMTYLGTNPCVTFEIDNIVAASFQILPSYVYFWSPPVNSGNAMLIAGPSNIPFFPNTGPTASYGVTGSISRPAIGTGLGSTSTIFLAMMATTDQTASTLDVYYATYFTVSYNGGATWMPVERITPTTPLKDYRYVSVSQKNSMNDASNMWKVQMMVCTHDYAGAYAPNEPPAASDFSSMIVDVPLTGINEISSTVPTNFSLKQNYPNPFNPTTSIRFDIQKSAKVTLEVYSSNGQKVETLINNEFVSPGTKEVTFNASNLSSGVYFYTLSTGDIKETKKMTLIK